MTSTHRRPTTRDRAHSVWGTPPRCVACTGVIVDSSSLICLARAGLLDLLNRLPERPRILDVVWDEVVRAGRAGQHADAFAVQAVLGRESRQVSPVAPSVDQAVLEAALADGALLANDLTLGRRARNLGARWLRTADLVLLLYRAERRSRDEACHGIESLWSAGHISESLRHDYLEAVGE